MLLKIGIENFKPFSARQRGRLAPLTLIYGPNSGGKSSIVQSLMLLRQSVGDQFNPDHPLVAKGDWVDVGSFKSLLHRHDMTRSLRLEVSFQPSFLARTATGDALETVFEAAQPRAVALTFDAETSSGTVAKEPSAKPYLSRIDFNAQYLVPDAPTERQLNPGTLLQSLAVELKRIPANEYLAKLLPLDQIEHSTYEWASEESIRSYAQFLLSNHETVKNRPIAWEIQQIMMTFERALSRTSSRKALFLGPTQELLHHFVVVGRNGLPAILAPKEPLPGPIRSKEAVHLAPGFGSIFAEYQALLRGVEYLGPLRRYPERYYLVHDSADNVGKEGENTPQLLSRSDYIVDTLNEWFQVFHISYSVAVKRQGDEVVGEIMAIHLEDQRTKTHVSATDVGFGLGQILPVLVQGISSGGKTICVEQPEIHLHPRLQGTLGDYFLWSSGAMQKGEFPERMGDARQPNQWIVETHSEALILRVLRRIREGAVKRDDVSVIYVSPEVEIGSEMIELEIDDKGKFIQTWPDGFFEEAYREMFVSK
jgi:predicted ATPase